MRYFLSTYLFGIHKNNTNGGICFFLFILFAEKKDVDAYWLQFSLENISRDNCLDHGTHICTRTHTHTNTRDALQRTTRANKWANDFDFNEPTSRRTEELTNQRRTKLTNRFCISYFYLMAPKWDTQTPLDPRLVCDLCVCCGLCWFLHFGYVRSFGNCCESANCGLHTWGTGTASWSRKIQEGGRERGLLRQPTARKGNSCTNIGPQFNINTQTHIPVCLSVCVRSYQIKSQLFFFLNFINKVCY